ncbi:MAG TPA: carboxypeptidase-like regulatory domain-containing protein [Thermoanaerobaculaceae bacterium]|nr:carboxypeptidase-like regulatory domain-containing protein [Thermoanaerobaculaceae bacterium]
MHDGIFRRTVAGALLAGLAPWCVGCATGFYVRTGAGADGDTGTGALEVRVYENGSARSRAELTHRRVTVELYTRGGKPERLVHADDAARWSVPGLAPGRYSLRVWWPDAKGSNSEAQPVRKRIVVRAGETAVANVVLKDGAKTWLGVGIAVGVLAASLYLNCWSPLGNFSLGGTW